MESLSISSGIATTFVEDSFVGTASVSKVSNRAGELTLYTFEFEPKNSIP